MFQLMEKIISLAKRRGFIFPSSEIYGGFKSCYDFGPLGVLMKNNIKKAWWEEMTRFHENIFGLDSAILMHPKTWEASGHLAGFSDKLTECLKCHKRFKADETGGKKCPLCGGKLTPPENFNLMVETYLGPVKRKRKKTYLRPETCQGIYLNFLNVLNSMRAKIPFGICQIGKAFRNEITPKDFLYRIREFEQMEMQWFCHPKEADKYFNYWLSQRLNWFYKLKIKKTHLRANLIPKKERAHYARRQVDIEYRFPFGWREIEGIHNRGDWDLKRHSLFSKKDLSYFDPIKNERYIPYIIETSVGVERIFFAFLCEGYTEIKGGRTGGKGTKKEIVLKLSKLLSPIKVAVFPLVKNKPQLIKLAKEVYFLIKPHFPTIYDEVGSIGRRYRRQDEIGTPFCLTIDFLSLKKKDLTVRDRDSMTQERIKIGDILKYLKEKLNEI